jgi:hypothetical protein
MNRSEDNDCNLGGNFEDSFSCGQPAPFGTGYHWVDNDCGKVGSKTKSWPIKTDQVCGEKIWPQAPFPGDRTQDLDCGEKFGGRSKTPYRSEDSACGKSNFGGGGRQDFDCAKTNLTGVYKHKDSSCDVLITGRARWNDIDCGKPSGPGTKHTDDD